MSAVQAAPAPPSKTSEPAVKPAVGQTPAATPAKSSPLTQSLQKPANQISSPPDSLQFNPYLAASSAKPSLPVASAVDTSKPTPASKRGRELLYAGVGVIVTLLLVAGGWFIFGRTDSTPAVATESTESKEADTAANAPKPKPAKVAEKPAVNPTPQKPAPEIPAEPKRVPQELTAEEAAFGQDPPATTDTDDRGIFAKPATAKTSTVPADPPAGKGLAQLPPRAPVAPTPNAKQAKSEAPVIAAPQSVGQANNLDLKYQWRLGNSYTYQFEYEVEGNPRRKIAGRVSYSVDKAKSELLRKNLKSRSEGGGSGTAFIVNSDGILATCEHVVRKAKKIFVTIGERKYEAIVIAQDEKHDLALLKISANGLPVVPLSDKPVGLLQNVVAVGFPLSSVLGKSVKATEGTIASQAVNAEGFMQLNANINPGNSGGPLFNSAGEVIGVCNAKLVGREISNVGFAVPVDWLKQLLASQNLAGNAPAAELAPPDNAAMMTRVTPAVVLVEVGEFAGKVDLQVVNYSYRTDRNETGIDSKSTSGGEFVTDDRGEIVFGDDDPGLMPLQFTGYESLAMERLAPKAQEKSWEVNRKRAIVESSSSPSRRRPPGLPSLPLPPGSSRAPKITELAERIIYRVGEKKGDTVTLLKEHSVATLVPGSNVQNRQILLGSGTVTFDLVRGLPIASQMIYRTHQDHPSIGETRFAYAYKLDKTVTAEEIEARVEAHAKRDRTADVRGILTSLPTSRFPPSELMELASIPPIEALRGDVAKMLNKYLASNEPGEVIAAFSAVKKWGTDVNVTALLRYAGMNQSPLQHTAMELLGELSKTSATAIKLGLQLNDPSNKIYILSAWKAIGPPAEDAALTAFQKAKDDDKLDFVQVLADIGGAKTIKLFSVYPVKKDQNFLKLRLEDAVRKCRERLAALEAKEKEKEKDKQAVAPAEPAKAEPPKAEPLNMN